MQQLDNIKKEDGPLNRVSYRLSPVQPFRLDLTVWALRRVAVNIMDRWDGQRYQRVLVSDGEPFEITVIQTGPPGESELEVTAVGKAANLKTVATAGLERLLGIKIDLSDFYRFAYNDRIVESLARKFLGFKPPRFPTVFEAVVNAIACQQISLVAGISLLNRLCQAYGRSITDNGLEYHAFPQPEALAGLEPGSLRIQGFSRAKSLAIIELSSAVVNGLDLEQLSTVDDEDALTMLYQLRGIGRWTGEYVLLRGLGRWHIFPGDDVGARKRLHSWLGLEEAPDYDRLQGILAPWEPYAGLIYFHLLLNHIEETGNIK